MVDQVRSLLINRTSGRDYVQVDDSRSDEVLLRFGVSPTMGDEELASAVDAVLPLAMAPDLATFRRFYDQRVTPVRTGSVYCTVYGLGGHSLTGLYDRVLGPEGWWTTARLFEHDDVETGAVLADMLPAARTKDAAFALGAVLLACAYRRFMLQPEEVR